MKVLVTGYHGQLGYDVIKCLQSREIECIGTDLDEFDITDPIAAEQYITSWHPDAVVHCAAYTAVDRAEENEELCRKVNVTGTANIAAVCKKISAKLIYISTDYVFPGSGADFYETDDPTGPLSVYGRTKLEGETAVKVALEQYFIVRISWVFGKNGTNFVKTMLRLGKERDEVSVVCDQIGSPTYTKDLAPLLCDMLETERYGTYHATNEGVCSWAEFTKEIFQCAGYRTRVKPILTEEYKTLAPRPKNSRLSKKSLDSAGFLRLPDWKDAVSRYLKELSQSD